MDNSELQNLIIEAQKGNEQALKTIVEEFQGLIAKVVYSQFRKLSVAYNETSSSLLEIEDLLSIAQIAFIKAVQTFLPTRNPDFVLYASMKIKFELFQQVKKLQGPVRLPGHIFAKRNQQKDNKAISRWWSSSRLAVQSQFSSALLSMQLVDAQDVDLYEIYKKDLLNLIEDAFSTCEKRLFALKMDGLSCKEIAHCLGLSPQKVSQIFRLIIGKTTNLEELEKRLIQVKEMKETNANESH